MVLWGRRTWIVMVQGSGDQWYVVDVDGEGVGMEDTSGGSGY